MRLWTDIEFKTYSACNDQVRDRSAYHELDLVLVDSFVQAGRPRNDEIYLGVECKARLGGLKETIKQVLGVRREMSLLTHPEISKLGQVCGTRPSPLDRVPADPASEFWLYHTSPDINLYEGGPMAFGVRVIHCTP